VEKWEKKKKKVLDVVEMEKYVICERYPPLGSVKEFHRKHSFSLEKAYDDLGKRPLYFRHHRLHAGSMIENDHESGQQR
jgi:hypothetical protein